MILVGLTGGIGSGKSTVSAALAARGAVVLDGDAITKELQEPGQEVLARIVERFGADIVDDEGRLIRPKLAGIVFGDPAALGDLNAIVHPAVGAEIARRIDAQRATRNVVVLDIPLFVEGKGYPVAGVVVVDTPIDTAVDRLVRFRGFTEADARARMARQATREERLARADMVVDNSGTPEDLVPQIDTLWEWMSTLPHEEDRVAEPSPPSGDSEPAG